MLDNAGHFIDRSYSGQAYTTVYFEMVEQTITPLTIGNGNTVRGIRT